MGWPTGYLEWLFEVVILPSGIDHIRNRRGVGPIYSAEGGSGPES